MVTLKEILEISVYWVVTYIIGFLYTCYYTITVIFSKPKQSQENIPDQELPPPCLFNPLYGTHKFYKSQNVKLHYVESGDSNCPLVILIHGVPGFWYCWRKQIPVLARDFRVIAVDLRGCGDSEYPSGKDNFSINILVKDILALITSLDCGPASIVCCETSGHIAWKLAYKHPELIARIVFINALHPIVINKMFNAKMYQYFKYWYMLFLHIPILPEYINSTDPNPNWSKTILDPAIKAKDLSKEELQAYRYTFSRRDDWRGVINHLRLVNLQPQILNGTKRRTIVPSAKILIGNRHPYFTAEHAYRSAVYAQNIEVFEIKNGGCNLQVSHPQQTNNIILQFLRDTKYFDEVDAKMTPEKSSTYLGRMFGAVTSTVTSPYAMVRAKSDIIVRKFSTEEMPV